MHHYKQILFMHFLVCLNVNKNALNTTCRPMPLPKDYDILSFVKEMLKGS